MAGKEEVSVKLCPAKRTAEEEAAAAMKQGSAKRKAVEEEAPSTPTSEELTTEAKVAAAPVDGSVVAVDDAGLEDPPSTETRRPMELTAEYFEMVDALLSKQWERIDLESYKGLYAEYYRDADGYLTYDDSSDDDDLNAAGTCDDDDDDDDLNAVGGEADNQQEVEVAALVSVSVSDG